jgi:hypothetical protein
MIDLHNGVVEVFAEAQRDDAVDWDAIRARGLSFDSETVRSFAHEANYIAAARCAPGINRWFCPNCGEEVETRPGSSRPLHMGTQKEIALDCLDTIRRYTSTQPGGLGVGIRRQTTFAMTEEDLEALKALAQHMGLDNRSAVVRLAIREALAARQKKPDTDKG